MLDPSQYPGRSSFVTGGAPPQGAQPMAAPQNGMSQPNALLQAGVSTAPTSNWTQGMARIASALVGGNQKRQMMAQQQAPGAPQPGAMGGVLGAAAPQ